MSQESEVISSLPEEMSENTQIPLCPSPALSRVYSRTMIKSMENILIDDNIEDKIPIKKSLDIMRRSETLKDISEFKLFRRSGTNITFERLKTAKMKVDDAIQKGKVFTVLGPYRRIREVLRNRGWVEKFYLNTDVVNNALSTRKSRSNTKANGDRNIIVDDGDDIYDDADDDDIDDDDGDGDEPGSNGLPPWEEEDGIYGIMSRMLKNTQPNLFWTLRKSQVDYRILRKDQIINHHAKAGTFTTKTGLAKCLNQLRWFDDKEPDEFFPRCFIISTVEEKHAFIDDFHFTACVSLIKEIIDDSSDSYTDSDDLIDVKTTNLSSDLANGKSNKKILPKINYCGRRKDRKGSVGYKFLEMAIAYCEFIMKIKNHEDIDRNDFIFCWSCDWEEFLTNYYKVVHDGFKVEGACNEQTRKRCLEIAHELKKIFPQFDMEGSRNVWILKPGAKSRGRGIMCYSRLNDVLKLLTNSFVTNENRFIVQKYIERPLLIYNTKFDIRQWFMVTDWNPLTVWWYKDCYLRFCSQQYTLDDFNEAVHLSNNSIQYKYQNGPRSELLPTENMWDWVQFEDWMKHEGHGNAYNSIILPGMKEAVIDVLLCVQDSVEWRKNTFELYGADFMVSENDLKPWLIEINSSPCMSPSTPITARLTSTLLEDIFKVVLDRRDNKQCETGRFELLYKQNAIFVPPYIGIDLKLAGTSIKNPVTSTLITERRSSTRPITDSFILRKIRNNKDLSVPRKNVNETVLVNSGNLKKEPTRKVIEKANPYHKRSNTTVEVNSTNIRSKSSVNKLSVSTPTPATRNTITPHQSSDTHRIRSYVHSDHSLSDIENGDVTISDSDFSTLKKSSKNRPMAGDSARSKSESYDHCVFNHTSLKALKLPNATKLEKLPKSPIIKPERHYKLPTKVELVNFTLTKHQSIDEANLKKTRMSSKLFKKPNNSQMFIQKSSLTESSIESSSNISFPRYERSYCEYAHCKRVPYNLTKIHKRSNSQSKNRFIEKLHPSASELFCRQNRIHAINFSMPLTY